MHRNGFAWVQKCLLILKVLWRTLIQSFCPKLLYLFKSLSSKTFWSWLVCKINRPSLYSESFGKYIEKHFMKVETRVSKLCFEDLAGGFWKLCFFHGRSRGPNGDLLLTMLFTLCLWPFTSFKKNNNFVTFEHFSLLLCAFSIFERFWVMMNNLKYY